MPGTGTWGNIGTNDPSERAFVIQCIDSSGDTWAERLIVALTATLAAVQAWIVVYQAATQASVWQVTEENAWTGARESGNALFLARSGIENGINMSFQDPVAGVLMPLRVIAPVPNDMESSLDIPNTASTELTNLITATIGLKPDYNFTTAQYTTRRERKNNPKVV